MTQTHDFQASLEPDRCKTCGQDPTKHMRNPNPMEMVADGLTDEALVDRVRRMTYNPRFQSPQARRAYADEIGRRFMAYRAALVHIIQASDDEFATNRALEALGAYPGRSSKPAKG